MINTDYFKRWNELDERIEKKEGNEYTTMFVFTDSINNVYISNDKNKNRSFYIEFEEDFIKDYTPLKINGVHIDIEKNERINKDMSYLVVRNLDSENDNAFIGFSVIVFNELEHSRTNDNTLLAFENVVEQHHDFFSFKQQISKKEEQGLLAELLLLDEYIDVYGESFVNSWYGSEKNKRDFIIGNSAIEIKSSLNQEQDIIHVSNENQLDKGELDNLYLRLYIFDENSLGIDVIEEYNRIINKLTSIEYKKMLVTKMTMRGINPSNYDCKYKFKLEMVKKYLVDDRFPKIIKENIPNQAYDVKYKLNISDVAKIEKESL